MKIRERRRMHHPPMDELRQTRADIFKASGGLRADFDRLSAEEAHELRNLTIEARNATRAADVEGCDPGRLTVQDRGRWEKLVERAAADTGWFARTRAQAKKEQEDAAKARKPSKQPRWEEPGVTVIPAPITLGLQAGNLNALHWLILSLVLAGIENQCSIHAYAGYEDGAVLVNQTVDIVRGIDPDGDISHVSTAIQELVAADLLLVERGDLTRIRLGALLSDALAQRARS
jgi:hypothetical protein